MNNPEEYSSGLSQLRKTMKKYSLVCFMLINIACISCRKSNHNVFLGDSPLKVRSFDKEIDVEGQHLPIDLLGMGSVFVYDTIMIITHPQADKMYSIVSLNDNALLGSFVNRGNGENELTSLCWPLYFEKTENGIIMAFHDSDASKIRFLNISETVFNQKTSFMDDEIDVKQIPGLYRFYPIDRERFFVDFLDMLTTTQHYATIDTTMDVDFSTNITAINMNLESLSNSFLMATNTTYNQTLGRYAAGMNFINQINIFDINNPEKSISVSTQDHRTDTKEVERIPMPEKMEYYFDMRSTDSYLFALYANQNRKDWAMGNNPGVIHVFDWNGNPITQIKTSEKLIQFDIDASHNRLYGLTSQDELFVYNLPVSFN